MEDSAMEESTMTTATTGPLTLTQRVDLAQRFAAALVAEYRWARTKVWAKGDHVRLYIADPRDRGCVEILADGRLAASVRGMSHVLGRAATAIGAEII